MNVQLRVEPPAGTAAGPAGAPRPAELPAEGRHWPESNCYVDLWVELLAHWGLEAVAALPFTAALDFEGEGFTFFKFPAEDLEALFGVRVGETSFHDTLERHVVDQVGRGRAVLVEADGFHLPDTLGTTYGREHGKTTIGVLRIDPARREAEYLHNRARGVLSGADYDGVLSGLPERLPPYVESVRRVAAPLAGEALRHASRGLLRRHLARRPERSPLAAWRDAFPAQLDGLLRRDAAFFHRYAFDNFRQLGANFEFLGNHAAWLDPDAMAGAVRGCEEIAAGAKTLQYRLARLVHRRRADRCDDAFDALEHGYERVMTELARHA